MSRTKAEIILTFIVLALSTSYLLMLWGSNIQPFNLIAMRFLLAFTLMGVLFFKRLMRAGRKTLLLGLSLGTIVFINLVLQVYGLRTLTTSGAGFLNSTTVVFVPVFHALLRKRMPHRNMALGFSAALIGIALLTITEGFRVTTGAIFYVLSAIFLAFHILAADHFAKETDLLAMSIIELGIAGILALGFAFALETPRLPSGTLEWVSILGLGLVCSAFGIGLQPVTQQYTTPERYSLILGLGPVFSAALGIIFLQEYLSVRGYIGAGLVLFGVLFTSRQKEAFAAKKNAQGLSEIE